MYKKFIDIVKPAGILCTFNLCHTKNLSPEEYRAFYRGYEIANHCKNHPIIFRDNIEYKFSDEPCDRDNSSTEYVYKTETPDVYLMHISLHLEDKTKYPKPRGWHSITDEENYKKFADETKADLESVFGEGSVRGFVWPHGKQYSQKVVEYFKSQGYNSVRKTGDIRDKTGFSLPEDRWDWTYNAHNMTLLEVMELYESYPDDGKLKFFSFGVHSIDFERAGNWCDLEDFARKYGNRPEDYYYATVSDIFDYEDATGKIEITDTQIKNPTETTLYIKVDEKRVILYPNSTYSI